MGQNYQPSAISYQPSAISYQLSELASYSDPLSIPIYASSACIRDKPLLFHPRLISSLTIRAIRGIRGEISSLHSRHSRHSRINLFSSIRSVIVDPFYLSCIRYPTPGSVRIYRGWSGFGSILRRRLLTFTRSRCDSSSYAAPHTWRSSWVWVNTLPSVLHHHPQQIVFRRRQRHPLPLQRHLALAQVNHQFPDLESPARSPAASHGASPRGCAPAVRQAQTAWSGNHPPPRPAPPPCRPRDRAPTG